ncbi:protein-L-isoaspartate(D-aspartate) O-methyltransferase [Micromonospora matsumotoense]|uniref:Protein-L-isoaspartate O-methyltransferase n=1 Tax=Micromonospora matsumotoense TaxID=121616 RepID=A0A1C5AUE9_9ACTN|nr:methyltransferase, FxLD system [Micromonospora matsumotoense]SCF48756.1 protein-L-isoaspartate(D-aspartate) O-methyltransferase [Micromonospora matsumotoense]
MVQVVDAERTAEMRDVLVAELRTQGMIMSDAVEAAFRRVPREQFMPDDTDLAVVYGYDRSVVTKRDGHGRAMSSVSAAYIQARMLELADLRPGMTVLEVGSGGLNAAYLAEVVGSQGRVVSIDIDPEVIDRAASALDAIGHSSRVRVLVADAERGVPGEGPFDAIIVTVGAWDVAPAWLRQLRPDGVLVLPLIMNNVTRVIGFRRDGDHLVSTATEVAGFVPMQGDGSRTDQVLELPEPSGRKVRLTFDSDAPANMSQLDGVLATDQIEVWSGVTIEHGVSFADLHLWLAWYADGFCRLSADEGTALAAQKRWFPFAVVQEAGFAYLALRDALEGAGAEFGARAYGADGQVAAAAMVEQIRAWDREGHRTSPTFAYWPTGSDPARISADATVMDKTHGVLTISWPRE